MCRSMLFYKNYCIYSSKQHRNIKIIIPILEMRDEGLCSLSKVVHLESSLAKFDAKDCSLPRSAYIWEDFMFP